MNYILRLLHLIILMLLALMSAQLFMGIMQLVGIIATADKWNLKHLGTTRLLIAGILCVIIAGGIYLMKKNSADGRFLMWKVALQAVTEAHINGAGWDNVAGTYGEAQERYSVNRYPNRLYPHYLLMQLYGDTSYLNPAARQREVRILLDMNEKIPFPAVEEMREEAKSVLKTIHL